MNPLRYNVVVTLLIGSLCYYVQAKGISGFTARHSKRSNGETVFKDEASVTLNDGQSERLVTLKKVNADQTNYPNQAFYTNNKRTVHCLEECNTDKYCTKLAICLRRCLEFSKDGSHFYKEDDFLFLPGKVGEVRYDEPVFETIQADEQANDNYQMYMEQEPFNAPHNKRNVLPNQPGSDVGTIRVLYYTDLALVTTFMDFAGGIVADTKLEVKRFLQLATNEVALVYGTLSQYNLTTTLNGVSHPLDITVHMVDVMFPPDDGSAFSEASWVDDSMSGIVYYTTSVYNYLVPSWNGYNYYDQYPETTGALVDFSNYLKTSSDKSTYDIAEYITGADVVYENVNHYYVYSWCTGKTYYWYSDYEYSPAVVGFAWSPALCKDTLYSSDPMIRSSSMSELLTVIFSTIISHEIGHNAGMAHDVSEACPPGTYIMSPYGVEPDIAPSTINSFSPCSAQGIKNYLDSLHPMITEDSCLYGTPPSSADFVTAFCQGLTGNYTFDQQCQLFFRNSTLSACTTFTNGYVGNDECDDTVDCARNCAPPTNIFTMYNVFHGTRCRSPDNTEGNMICYNRACVEPSTLCTT